MASQRRRDAHAAREVREAASARRRRAYGAKDLLKLSAIFMPTIVAVVVAFALYVWPHLGLCAGRGGRGEACKALAVREAGRCLKGRRGRGET